MNPFTIAPWALAALLAILLGVQTVRVSNAKNDFREYKIEQQEIVQRQIDVANKQRKDASDAYKEVQKKLESSIESGEVLKRCIAAGKCGVQHKSSRSSSKSVPTPKRTNETSTNTVPTGQGISEEITFLGNGISLEVVNDCAITTLQLNSLQEDIEKQPGYKE